MMNNNDIERYAETLDELELFKELSFAELKSVARYLTHESRAAGEVVFAEGDPGTHMLILIEGRLSIFKGGDRGNQLLCHEGRGRIVGEMALLDHERRSATCVAESDCSLLVLSHEGLNHLAEASPLLAYRLMLGLAKLLSRRLRRTSGMLVEFLVS